MRVPVLPTSWGVAFVRIMAGVILIVAGWQKYASSGFDGFSKGIANFGLPLPEFFGILIPALETVGGALLILGLGARWVAVLFIIEFLVTSFVLKAVRQPPFGGWDSMRIDLMILATVLSVALVGPGALALERQLKPFGSQRPTATPQPVPAGDR